MLHTSYLSFLLHGQDFRKPNFTPKKTTKGTKNTKNVSEKVKYMHFFHSIWKNLHLTEIFYTGTACGAGDKYEVCLRPLMISFHRHFSFSVPYFFLKISLKKSNICIFFHSIWKNLHLTENFYTDMSVVSVTNIRYE